MVSIVAFQAVDPGSIPGHRNSFGLFEVFTVLKTYKALFEKNNLNSF